MLCQFRCIVQCFRLWTNPNKLFGQPNINTSTSITNKGPLAPPSLIMTTAVFPVKYCNLYSVLGKRRPSYILFVQRPLHAQIGPGSHHLTQSSTTALRSKGDSHHLSPLLSEEAEWTSRRLPPAQGQSPSSDTQSSRRA